MASIRQDHFEISRDKLIDLGSVVNSTIFVFNDVSEMRYVREWLCDGNVSAYTKYGHFIYDPDTSKRVYEQCVGTRFVFNNEIDLGMFKLSCFNGKYIESEFV